LFRRSFIAVVAGLDRGLDPATPIVRARRQRNRDGRDKRTAVRLRLFRSMS
jgi:hypothetical protein